MAMAAKKTDEEWKQVLSKEQYDVLRKKGTQKPFTGEYDSCTKKGTYHCAGCGAALFSSFDKFDAECGWPSFTKPLFERQVEQKEDKSHFMTRTEVLCTSCGGHLGHVFDDGPKPAGKRYCINSASLKLKEM